MASKEQIQTLADRYISQIKANPLATSIFVDGIDLWSQPKEVIKLVTAYTNSLEYMRLVDAAQAANAPAPAPLPTPEPQTLSSRYGVDTSEPPLNAAFDAMIRGATQEEAEQTTILQSQR